LWFSVVANLESYFALHQQQIQTKALPHLCHPVDKPKGVVKGVGMRRVAVSNWLAMSLETCCQREPSQGIIFGGKGSSTIHRYGRSNRP
jgi:hypothetical protein